MKAFRPNQQDLDFLSKPFKVLFWLSSIFKRTDCSLRWSAILFGGGPARDSYSFSQFGRMVISSRIQWSGFKQRCTSTVCHLSGEQTNFNAARAGDLLADLHPSCPYVPETVSRIFLQISLQKQNKLSVMDSTLCIKKPFYLRSCASRRNVH